MEIGRLCIKTAGREAGKKCMVVDTAEQGMVIISGPGVKRRRCNPLHLQPLPEVMKISKGASDKDVYKLFGAEYKEKELEQPKKEKKAEEKKEEKKKEKAPKKFSLLSKPKSTDERKQKKG